MIKKLKPFFPAFGWGLVILVVVSLPPSNLPDTRNWPVPHPDKVVHFIMFALLGILTVLGFVKKHRSINYPAVIISMATGLFYGAATEWLQFCCLEGRHGNLADVIANGFGTVFGVLVTGIIYNIRMRK